MKQTIDPSLIPGEGKGKKIELKKITLKNVLFGETGKEDIEVEVVPFDPRNDDHASFAYSLSDMTYNVPSPIKDMNSASREYVRLFMKHAKEDEANVDSNFRKVYGDLRACRVLLLDSDFQKALSDFFDNA